jgi:hypothetical protein
MHDTLAARIEDMELNHRQMLEALAKAIDRSSRGQEPHALETVAKSVVPRRTTTRKPAAKKTTAKPKRGKSKSTSARRAESSE